MTKGVTLSEDQISTFKKMLIDSENPGSILRDFETCLEFIRNEGGIPASGKHNLFAISLLPELNDKMSHPIKIDMTRPQQKSYPNINGLYLLLRTTGLIFVKQTGKKQLLVLDEQLLDSWKALNLTERYFSLLRAWFWYGNEETVGENKGRGYFDQLYRCMNFFKEIPQKGIEILDQVSSEESLRYYPGIYNLALMELFGMVEVHSAPPSPGKGWKIKRIKKTEWGNALAGSLIESVMNCLDIYENKTEEELKNFDASEYWISLVRPYFKEWNNLLESPEPEFRNSVHIFKVSLGKAWKRIAVAGDCFMNELSGSILDAFDFDRDHLYRFSYKDRYGVTSHVDHPFSHDFEGDSADEVKVGDLPLSPGMKMTFLYDFGDDWEFEMLVENTDADMKIKAPSVLESKGKAPAQYQDFDSWE